MTMMMAMVKNDRIDVYCEIIIIILWWEFSTEGVKWIATMRKEYLSGRGRHDDDDNDEDDDENDKSDDDCDDSDAIVVM